jgi:hypothetical protein
MMVVVVVVVVVWKVAVAMIVSGGIEERCVGGRVSGKGINSNVLTRVSYDRTRVGGVGEWVSGYGFAAA